VLCHPKLPSQVAKLIGHVAVANVLAKTGIPGDATQIEIILFVPCCPR
jgi:hypothetical protein